MSIAVKDMAKQLSKTGRLHLEKAALQHGSVTVYAHSLRVAEASVWIASHLPLRIDEAALIRGALLHDYFLYNWHEKNRSHAWHGFRHPRVALENARADYQLSRREENIILRHMFPLTPIPPACREAWIVCAADKYCALVETVEGLAQAFKKR